MLDLWFVLFFRRDTSGRRGWSLRPRIQATTCRSAALWSAPAKPVVRRAATALWLAEVEGMRSQWRLRSKAASALRSAAALHRRCVKPASLTSSLLRARILHHLKDFPCTVSSTRCLARLRPPQRVKPLIWHNLRALATKSGERRGPTLLLPSSRSEKA